MNEHKDDGTRKVEHLVLFLSDVAYFAKRWKPIRVEFYGRQETKILWRISRKRRAIKAAVLEKKKQNDTHHPERG